MNVIMSEGSSIIHFYLTCQFLTMGSGSDLEMLLPLGTSGTSRFPKDPVVAPGSLYNAGSSGTGDSTGQFHLIP